MFRWTKPIGWYSHDLKPTIFKQIKFLLRFRIICKKFVWNMILSLWEKMTENRQLYGTNLKILIFFPVSMKNFFERIWLLMYIQTKYSENASFKKKKWQNVTFLRSTALLRQQNLFSSVYALNCRSLSAVHEIISRASLFGTHITHYRCTILDI